MQKRNRQTMKELIKRVFPKTIWNILNIVYQVKFNRWQKNLKKLIIKHYHGSNDPEVIAFINYFKKHSLTTFLHSDQPLSNMLLNVEYDMQHGLYYARLQIGGMEKRLYLSKNIKNKKEALEKYREILYEQLPDSAHRYFNAPLQEIARDRVVVEVGAADGMFSLECAKTAKAIYVFEPEQIWIDALNCTFPKAVYPNTTIVKKIVSDRTEGDSIRLDDYFPSSTRVDVLKMDVEGAEMEVLVGAKRLIQENPQMQLIIATYHKAEHFQQITEYLDAYQIEPVKGKVCFFWCGEPDCIRKCVIRAHRDLQL